MPNLKDEIEEMAAGEAIEGVVIGDKWIFTDPIPGYDQQRRNVLLTWADAARFLDYEYDNDYGSPGCNPFTAWTASFVIAVSQDGGLTELFKLPRNPVDHGPVMPGG